MQRPRKGFQKSCHIARKELWCRLRAPSLGTQQQYCTWGAALQGGQFQMPQAAEASCPKCGVAGACSCGLQPDVPAQAHDGRGMRLAKLLGGAIPKTVYAEAARKLRRREGVLTPLEFEYFAVREIGLDLETARKACGACLEAQAKIQAGVTLAPPVLETGVETSLLAEALEDCAGEEIADPGFVLEARLELEWRSVIGLGASAAAGELRLFAAELRPRELPKATGISQLAMFDGGYYAHVTCPVVTAQKW